MKNEKKGSLTALLPIGVFVVLYLGLGCLFEYGMKIEMGFYNIPILVVFMAALLVACIQNRHIPFDDQLAIMAKGVGDKNIVTMLLIFMTAGIFAGVVGRSSAESVAYFLLSLIPARFAVLVLFVVAAFVSLSMGTSVGTITLIVPVAVAVAEGSGFSVPLCAGVVVGGAMFGDNLSFISDTTIAACNSQGCRMKDKFYENIGIALPAALVSMVLILIVSLKSAGNGGVQEGYNLIEIIPYLIVLAGGVIGLNVFIVLITGIVTGSVIILLTGSCAAADLLANMGSGVNGMMETSMVAILVSAICALIKEVGGFDALLALLGKIFRGARAGQLGIGLLVGILDISTANNTVAIVMAGPIAKEMSQTYGISPKRTASLLDTFSCIFQGIIPYGAQMLVALSIVSGMGYSISAFELMPNLIYPYILLLISLFHIFVRTGRNERG